MAVIDLRAADDDQQARVVEATLRCIARWGQAKTSLDDVAREAGLSRATVYRLVPGGKENLLVLVSTYELNRFFVSLHEAVQDVDTLEDTLVAGVTTAARHLQEHGALKFMLDHEPEHILPLFAFTNLDRILANVRAFAAPYLEPWLGDDAAHCAEWVARIVLSYTCAPSPAYDLADEESARRLVRTFVLPGITAVSTSTTESA
jgi:AcrR family transcriptional regulator